MNGEADMNDVGGKPGDGTSAVATPRRHRGRRAALAVAAGAASALALLAAGPGAASAATDRAGSVQPATTGPAITGPAITGPAITGVTWHSLSLINNWHTPPWGGDPGWAVQDGVVYLRGFIYQSPANSSASVTIGVLPKAARPAHKLYLNAYALGGFSDMVIYPNGVINVFSTNPLDAKSRTSLDGISFPAAPTSGHALTLTNGWQSGSQFGTGNPAYWVKDGTVHLLGSINAPSGASSETFAVLPPGARPARVLYISTEGYGGALDKIAIGTDGTMNVLSSQGDNFTSLAALSFPAAPTTGHKLTLINGWMSSQSQYGTGDPAYWVSNGVVHLLGSLKQPTGNDPQFALLPPAARPAHFIYIPTYTNYGAFGYLLIYPNGVIEVLNPGNDTSAMQYTSLANIVYPVNS
jgi:hypothetical protein